MVRVSGLHAHRTLAMMIMGPVAIYARRSFQLSAQLRATGEADRNRQVLMQQFEGAQYTRGSGQETCSRHTMAHEPRRYHTSL